MPLRRFSNVDQNQRAEQASDPRLGAAVVMICYVIISYYYILLLFFIV